MRDAEVLVVNLEGHSCEQANCPSVQRLIGQITNIRLVETQWPSKSCESKPPDCVPDCVVVRNCEADWVRSIRRLWTQPVLGVFCPGLRSEEISAALGYGLDDFVCCPLSDNEFIARIKRLLPRPSNSGGPDTGRQVRKEYGLDSLVGESECLLQLIARLPRLAGSDATCLISGETGTGKELFARAIHYISKRRSKPFVAANCGAVPDHLFENELFGHVRGAYTDASHAEVGLVALAEQGTLFLDEVDTLSPSAQVKLLRFLQDHEYRPLGSSCTIRADVRIVAATNAELRQSVEQRMFREDLFHRLNVLNLEIPPLRERVGDIPILANYFVVKYASQYGRDVVGLTSSAIAGLLNYRWPGNVRELEGVIQRAVILSSSRFLESVNLEIPVPTEPQSYSETTFQSAKQRAIHKFESEYLSTLLATHDGNVSRAAKAAGKERRSFQRLLQKHSMERVNFVKKPA